MESPRSLENPRYIIILMLSLCRTGPLETERTQRYKLCSWFSLSLLFLGHWEHTAELRPQPWFCERHSPRGQCSRAALRRYLAASLLQLDFDEEDEADQGDHDEESQENPHVEVFSGLLEQNTDTMGRSSLWLRDGHSAVSTLIRVRMG